MENSSNSKKLEEIALDEGLASSAQLDRESGDTRYRAELARKDFLAASHKKELKKKFLYGVFTGAFSLLTLAAGYIGYSGHVEKQKVFADSYNKGVVSRYRDEATAARAKKAESEAEALKQVIERQKLALKNQELSKDNADLEGVSKTLVELGYSELNDYHITQRSQEHSSVMRAAERLKRLQIDYFSKEFPGSEFHAEISKSTESEKGITNIIRIYLDRGSEEKDTTLSQTLEDLAKNRDSVLASIASKIEDHDPEKLSQALSMMRNKGKKRGIKGVYESLVEEIEEKNPKVREYRLYAEGYSILKDRFFEILENKKFGARDKFYYLMQLNEVFSNKATFQGALRAAIEEGLKIRKMRRISKEVMKEAAKKRSEKWSVKVKESEAEIIAIDERIRNMPQELQTVYIPLIRKETKMPKVDNEESRKIVEGVTRMTFKAFLGESYSDEKSVRDLQIDLFKKHKEILEDKLRFEKTTNTIARGIDEIYDVKDLMEEPGFLNDFNMMRADRIIKDKDGELNKAALKLVTIERKKDERADRELMLEHEEALEEEE